MRSPKVALAPLADGNVLNLRKCSEPGCGLPFYARGRCNLHYRDWYRGKPPRRRRTEAVLPPSFKRTTG